MLDIDVVIPPGSTLLGIAIINGFISKDETDPLIILKGLIKAGLWLAASAITEAGRSIEDAIISIPQDDPSLEELQKDKEKADKLFAIAQQFGRSKSYQENMTEIVLAAGTTRGFIINNKKNYVLPEDLEEIETKIIQLIKSFINDSFLLKFIS